jgi:hypothetical protein
MAGCLSASAANVRQTDSSVVRRKAEPKLNPKEAARMTASGQKRPLSLRNPVIDAHLYNYGIKVIELRLRIGTGD